jgi:alpha-L-fucosidase
VAVLAELGRRIAGLRARQIEARVPWHLGATFELGRPRGVEAIVLGEDIAEGQRVERVLVRGRRDGRWVPLAAANTVGYRRILTFPPARIDAVRIEIPEYRDTPLISRLAAVEEADS